MGVPPTSQHNVEEKPAQILKEKKQYPPVPEGYVLKFRWSYRDPRTDKIVRARNRPFPILVRADSLKS
jgi:hypothetical protein